MTQVQELIANATKQFKEGSIVKGRILEVRPREFLVDIGYKSEGTIPATEFDDPSEVAVGDEVEVLLVRLENDEGMVVLSKEKAAYRQNWDKISGVFEKEGIIKGRVKAVVKGGLLVNIGVEAFLPSSQIDIIPPKDLNQFVGNTYDFKIVKLSDERRNVVLSRRELIEQERSEKRQEFMANTGVGSVVTGTVKNLTDFGAFIDLGGMDGLLHITDMTWGRLTHPSELLKVGQEIQLQVLEINKDKATDPRLIHPVAHRDHAPASLVAGNIGQRPHLAVFAFEHVEVCRVDGRPEHPHPNLARRGRPDRNLVDLHHSRRFPGGMVTGSPSRLHRCSLNHGNPDRTPLSVSRVGRDLRARRGPRTPKNAARRGRRALPPGCPPVGVICAVTPPPLSPLPMTAPPAMLSDRSDRPRQGPPTPKRKPKPEPRYPKNTLPRL
jgi:predicted RNA-binding protein with RPS1 domain